MKSQAARGKPPIRFEATVRACGDHALVRLPDVASKSLPSRGQIAVQATIAGHAFRTVLEPDGQFGHWMRFDPSLQESTGLGVGDASTVDTALSEQWPESDVPTDLLQALSNAPQDCRDLWQTITPMARWEWVRWVNATANPKTRQRRVEASLSKLGSGKRRPCCFNLSACTDPERPSHGPRSRVKRMLHRECG